MPKKKTDLGYPWNPTDMLSIRVTSSGPRKSSVYFSISYGSQISWQ